MPMKFSIIVPVYNAEDYLRECLESISKQTYPEFEAILIDDGSTDCSLDICNEFCEKDSRFNAVSVPNGGVSSARNIGLDKAERKTLLDKSKYYLTFHSYKNLLKRIRKHNTQEIFSIKNSKINNKNYKIISLFGRKIKIKRKAKK